MHNNNDFQTTLYELARENRRKGKNESFSAFCSCAWNISIKMNQRVKDFGLISLNYLSIVNYDYQNEFQYQTDQRKYLSVIFSILIT